MARLLNRDRLQYLLTDIAAAGVMLAGPAYAEPTAITVRVIAADAKFV